MNHATFVEPSTLDLVLRIGEKQALVYERAPLLIKGNSKIGHLGPEGLMFLTRGIPYWSCPGATTGVGGCSSACYALYMSYLSLEREADIGCGYTYLALKDPDRLLRLLDRDLAAYTGFTCDKFVRVHDAGDFVSAEHVRVYHRLAEVHTGVQFWGMSHSFVIPEIREALLELNELPNVCIRESTDPVRPELTAAGVTQFHYADKADAVAWMRDRAGEGQPAILCPSQFRRRVGKKMVPVTTCLACQACWRSDRPVVVYKH